MKKGLIFSLEALFIAIIMMSLLFAQIKPLEETGQQTKTTLMNTELSILIYDQNKQNELRPPEYTSGGLDEQVCKRSAIYDYDTNKIVEKQFCKVN